MMAQVFRQNAILESDHLIEGNARIAFLIIEAVELNARGGLLMPFLNQC